MAYLEFGSGTGSLVDDGIEPDGIRAAYADDATTNPAETYLRHDLTLANVAIDVVVPDPEELAESDHHGHFADHYTHTHRPVEDIGNWGPAIDHEDEMPTLEAQQMHEL